MFTTEGMHPGSSLDTWRAYMGEVYFRLDIDAGGADAIIGELAKRSFAQTVVSTFRAGSQRVIRRKALTHEDHAESYCLVFPTAGVFDHRQRGGGYDAKTGGMYILNAAEPYEVDIADGSEMVCLTLPSELLRSRVRRVDDLCGGEPFADPLMTSTLRHMAEGALSCAPRVDPARLQDLCIELFELALPPGNRSADGMWRYSDAIATVLLNKVRDVIRNRFADPTFDVTDAASACRVSVRQLQSALQKERTTFTRELLECRLISARQMMTSRDLVARQIRGVAITCGFTSPAHFATQYRRRFGHSPSHARR